MCATFIAFLDSLEEPAAESDWLEIPVHLFEILPLEDPAHTASMALIQVYRVADLLSLRFVVEKPEKYLLTGLQYSSRINLVVQCIDGFKIIAKGSLDNNVALIQLLLLAQHEAAQLVKIVFAGCSQKSLLRHIFFQRGQQN